MSGVNKIIYHPRNVKLIEYKGDHLTDMEFALGHLKLRLNDLAGVRFCLY